MLLLFFVIVVDDVFYRLYVFQVNIIFVQKDF